MLINDINQNIISRLGLENAPDEERLAFLERAISLVTKRVMLRLMEILPADDIAKANELADDPEALLVFMAGKVEDFEGLLDSETEKVKNELVLGSSVPENSNSL
jgi:hypothetical protein